MKYDDVKVSILLATFNSEKFLETQLDSIINQTHSNWELIVSDDDSSDKTMDILNEYKVKFPEKIFILNNTQRFGNARDNFFHLLKTCSGSYIMFCDHDDKWLPRKIEVTLSRMMKSEAEYQPHTPILVHTDLNVVDENLNIIAPSFMKFENISASRKSLNYIMMQNTVTGCTMMINRELADLSSNPESVSNIIMHDWWLALTASAFGIIEYINEPTIMYRQHGNNSIGAKDTKNIFYIFNKIIKYSEIKDSLHKTILQAEEFHKTYSHKLSSYNLVLVEEYSKLYQKGKLSRIISMIRYRFFKYGFARKVAQIIWG